MAELMIEIKGHTLAVDGDLVQLRATCGGHAQAKELWGKIAKIIADVMCDEIKEKNGWLELSNISEAKCMSEMQPYGTLWDDLPEDEQQYGYWLAVRYWLAVGSCNRTGPGGLDYEVVFVARDVVGDIVWSVGLDADSTRHWRFLRRLDLPASAAEVMAQARREDVPETDFGNILTTPQT